MTTQARAIREWIPVILGAVGIVVTFLVWLITDRVEPAFIALFGSLVGVSEGANALREVSRSPQDGKPPS